MIGGVGQLADGGILMQAADRVEAWLAQAWPLWLAHGVDPDTGLFHEQLGFDGRPDPTAPLRVRVQGRQLHCWSRAGAAGHAAQARPLLERALAAIETRYWGQADGPGWIHLLDPAGRPLNRLRDTYDQAFMLFGLCGADQAGLARARPLADATLAFLDDALTDAGDRSLFEGLPPGLPRRSNPHMHLLEAMLAWFGWTGEAAFLDRANAVALLVRDRFLDRASGTLIEQFTADLRRAPPPLGDSVEPGHHFEWSWLLHRLAQAGGCDLREEAALLHRWALRHGLDVGGFAVDECDRLGGMRRRTARAWPQTELIKSHLANDAPDAAARAALALLDRYLATDVAGLWIDQFDADGQPCAPVVPASTLYHLVVAFEELLQAAGRPLAQPATPR